MEQLGILEFYLYGALSLGSLVMNLARGKGFTPNATLFANFAESLPEIFVKKVQQGEQAITGFFEKFGNFCTSTLGAKDKDGNVIKGAKALATNQAKSEGSMVFLLNGVGILNSIYQTVSNGLRAFKGTSKDKLKNNALAIVGAALAAKLATANGVSMWLISSTQERTSHALKATQPEERTEEQTESMEGIYGGANEDYRCGLKSYFAAIATLADAIMPNGYGGLVDALGGLFLNFQGLQNGRSMLKGSEEDEDSRFPVRFNGGFLNKLRPAMDRLSNWFFKSLQGVPPAQMFTELAQNPDDMRTLKRFHAAMQ